MVGEAQVTLTSARAACQPYPSHCERALLELQSDQGPVDPPCCGGPRAPWTRPAAEAHLPVYGSFLLPMWPVLCHLAGKEDLRDVLPLSDLPQRFFSPEKGHMFVFNGFSNNWGQKVKVNPIG